MPPTAQMIGTLGLAVALDLLLADPPNRFHPVAWMGHLIAAFDRIAPRSSRAGVFLLGGVLGLGGAAFAYGVGWLIERVFEGFHPAIALVLRAAILKTTLSIRGLAGAAGQVGAALRSDDLTSARRLLSWHLVSRDTSGLTASQVSAAAVESVAENTCDSVVAPILYYAVAGLPGALAYRFLNTADAMVGYRGPRHEWIGKVPARLDDLANLLPSRLSAILIILASPFAGTSLPRAWRIWRRDARRTASPNAGHPMSAASGALGIELEKVGAYRIGAGLATADASDIDRAIKLFRVTVALALVAVFLGSQPWRAASNGGPAIGSGAR